MEAKLNQIFHLKERGTNIWNYGSCNTWNDCKKSRDRCSIHDDSVCCYSSGIGYGWEFYD